MLFENLVVDFPDDNSSVSIVPLGYITPSKSRNWSRITKTLLINFAQRGQFLLKWVITKIQIAKYARKSKCN